MPLWTDDRRLDERGAPSSSAACPMSVGIDPLGASGSPFRQRQLQDRKFLLLAATLTDSHDHIIFGYINRYDAHRHPEDLRLKRKLEIVLDQGVETGSLLRFVV